MNHLSSITKKIQKWYDRKTFDKHRLGSFWCDTHWEVVKKSQKDKIAINPAVAAVGIASALYIKGIDAEGVRKQGRACCILYNIAEETPKLSGKIMLDGIFEKSRGW